MGSLSPITTNLEFKTAHLLPYGSGGQCEIGLPELKGVDRAPLSEVIIYEEQKCTFDCQIGSNV